jgi:hypothetical protein
MEKSEMLWIATKYFGKGYSYEDLCYGDDLYGREQYADEIWEYVAELHDMGRIAFYEKYKEYKLY